MKSFYSALLFSLLALTEYDNNVQITKQHIYYISYNCMRIFLCMEMKMGVNLPRESREGGVSGKSEYKVDSGSWHRKYP